MNDFAQAIHEYGPTVGIVFGFLANAFVLHGKRESDISAIRGWMDMHQREAAKRDEAVSELKEAVSALRAIAEGQDRRLELVEERRR